MASIISATTTNGLSTSADNSGSLQLATNNGTTAVTIDTSQNVGIGTTSPSSPTGFTRALDISNASSSAVVVRGGAYIAEFGMSSAGGWAGTNSNDPMRFATNATERMRINSSGDVLFNTTAVPNGTSAYGAGFDTEDNNRMILKLATSNTGELALAVFLNPNGAVGTIRTSGSATQYNTSSDYRLKENVAPMTGGLAKVAQLKPCIYTWKADGSDGQGFIAHELQEVCPQAVSGQKDAVNKDGSIDPQGVDTSFLVATLTSAIQELNAKVEAQAIRIAELEGAK
jgi:hypothetical protein